MASKTAGKVIECRAAVAWEFNQPLKIETVQVDPPKAHEIRIKIVSTTICHTDLTSLNDPSSKFPCIVGHGGAGIVESVGKGVTTFEPGDHVIPLYIPQCGKCKPCKSTKTNLCKETVAHLFGSTMPDGTSRFTCKGQKLSHFFGCSTYSEYTVVPEMGLCKINNKAPLNRMSLLSCAVPSGYGTALYSVKIERGSTCAIWGLGPVGLAVALGCRDSGASRIIGIDINPWKFEIAKKFGITECLNPKDYDKPMHEVLIEMTDGGLDFTFECAGTIETLKAAFESTVAGWGTTLVIGAPPPGQTVEMTPLKFLMGHKCKGNVFGDLKAKKDLPKLVDMYLEKKLPLDDFVTYELPFEKINEGLDIARTGNCVCCVVNY